VVVVAILALIGVAIVKPWSPSTQTAVVASVAPSATPAEATPAGPLRTFTPDPVAMLHVDWDAVGAALRPRDEWGMRILVLGGVISDPPAMSAGGVTEFWEPLDARAQGGDDSVTVSVLTGRIAAIGLTTPLDESALDVRVWDNRTEGWLAVPVNGLTPSADPTARLLTVPDGWSVDGAWPPGTYRVDVLGDYGVKHFDLQLDGVRETTTAIPGVRTTISEGQLFAMSKSIGGFIGAGSPSMVQLSVGLPASDEQHDEAEAWLSIDAGRPIWMPAFPVPEPAVEQPAVGWPLLEVAALRQSPLGQPPRAQPAAVRVELQKAALLGSAGVLGAVLGPDESFVTAQLTRIAPVREDLGVATLVEAPAGSRRTGIAVFVPPNGAPVFPDSAYRIDALVDTGLKVVSRSWDLPVLPPANGTESPLLEGVRALAHVGTDRWKVLAPGHKIAVSPLRTDIVPEDPGPDCEGGAAVGPAPAYLGIAVPLAGLELFTVQRLDGPERSAIVTVEASRLVEHLVVLRPLGATWSRGNYAMGFRRGPDVELVVVCVG
jgi:hypothetical protein